MSGLPRQSRDLSDEQVRDKFYAYWQKQKVSNNQVMLVRGDSEIHELEGSSLTFRLIQVVLDN